MFFIPPKDKFFTLNDSLKTGNASIITEILNQNEKMKNTIESNSLSANIFRTTRKQKLTYQTGFKQQLILVF